MIHKKIERFKSGIYLITNLTNNKKYVGSSVNVYNRFHTHSTKLKLKKHSCKHLESAYHKYGFDNFLFEVLEYCNKEDLQTQEQYWINKIKPGYNKRLIAHINLGISPSVKTRNKISKTLKENYKKGLKPYDQKHNWKAVLQYDIEGNFVQEFKNIADAERCLNCKSSHISDAIKHTRILCLGYYWRLKTQNYSLKIDVFKPLVVENVITNTINRYHSLAELCRLKPMEFTRNGAIKSMNKYLYKLKYKIYYEQQ